MKRFVLRLILDVVLTIALALVLLWAWTWFLGGDPAEAVGESVRLLFNFMDVGLAVWLVLLIVSAVRMRARGGVPAGLTFVWLLVGVILNLIVVTIVGFVQGGWAALLVLFAIEAGIACLIAAAVAVPLVHRAVKDAAPAPSAVE
jgi:hypothetical protein